jgi:hypothetical protein
MPHRVQFIRLCSDPTIRRMWSLRPSLTDATSYCI